MENPVDSRLWPKSSYSGNGGNCVEVAPWRKSSYSGNGGDCVEVAPWHVSSHSDNGGECVEVAETPRVIFVRDTKDRDGGTLEFTSAAWSAFIKTL
jgi:hypothetical protein